MLAALKKKVHPHHSSSEKLYPFVTRVSQTATLRAPVDIVSFAIGTKTTTPDRPSILVTKGVLREQLNNLLREMFPGDENFPELNFRGTGFTYGKANCRDAEEKEIQQSDTNFYSSFKKDIRGTAPSHMIIQVPLTQGVDEVGQPKVMLPAHFDLIEAFITSITERAQCSPVILFQVPEELMSSHERALATRHTLFHELLADHFTGEGSTPKNSHLVRRLPLYCCSTSIANKTLLPASPESNTSAPFSALLSVSLLASSRASKGSPMLQRSSDSGSVSMHSQLSPGSPMNPGLSYGADPQLHQPSPSAPFLPSQSSHGIYPGLEQQPPHYSAAASPSAARAASLRTQLGSSA